MTLTRRSFIARAAAAVGALVGLPWLPAKAESITVIKGASMGKSTEMLKTPRPPLRGGVSGETSLGGYEEPLVFSSGPRKFVTIDELREMYDSPREQHRRELAESWGREWDRVAFEALTGTESP